MKNDHYIKVPMGVAASYDLTWQEKFIYAEILYRHQLKDGCTAKQKTIGAKYNIGPDVCSRILKKLEIKKFINRSGGCIVPLKFVDQKSNKVDQKSTKEGDKKLTKSQQKVDQKSIEVDQKSTAHHIDRNKLKTNFKETQEKESKNDFPLNGQEEKSKKKKSEAAKKEKERFGHVVPPSFGIYQRAHQEKPEIYPAEPDPDDLKECRMIAEKLKRRIIAQNKAEGFPGKKATNEDIINAFSIFVDMLPDYYKRNLFQLGYIRKNFNDLVARIKNKGNEDFQPKKIKGSNLTKEFRNFLNSDIGI